MTGSKYIAIGAFVLAAAAGPYLLWHPEPTTPIVGVVRTTEIRIAPEVAGLLAAIKVEPGMRVRAGDIVAALSAAELSISRPGARAARRCESFTRKCLCRRSRRAGGLARGRDR